MRMTGKTYAVHGSIANRLRQVWDPQLRTALYLQACREYTGVSEGTKRKWRKVVSSRPVVSGNNRDL